MSLDGFFSSTRGHGATVFVVICLAWASLVVVLVRQQGFLQAGATLGVPVVDLPFIDMRQATDGIAAAAAGQDVINGYYTTRDLYPMRFPYHRSWLLFQYLGVRGSQTAVLAVMLGLGLLVHFVAMIVIAGNRVTTGVVLAAFACSPPVLLGLERGNPDLLLYLLVAAAGHLWATRSLPMQVSGMVLLFAAGALKFFPFAGALGVLPGDNARRRKWLLAAGIAAAVLFLVVEISEVLRIGSSPFASSDWASFGSAVSANTVARLVPRVTGVELPAIAAGLIRWFGIAALAFVAFRLARALARTATWTDEATGVLASWFAAGASIFTASFVMFRSYNYKFVFLALAIPALCEWARRRDLAGVTARWALGTMLIWIWSGLNGYAYLIANTLVSWMCVACVGALLLAQLGGRTGSLWPPLGPEES